MNAIDAIQCLLEKGLLTEEQANLAIQYATVFVGDPASALFLSQQSYQAGGSPLNSDSFGVSTTPSVLIVPPDNVKKVVATAIGGDVLFLVNGGTPTPTYGHIMKDGVNYTFTAQEWAGFRARTVSGNADITYTYFG